MAGKKPSRDDIDNAFGEDEELDEGAESDEGDGPDDEAAPIRVGDEIDAVEPVKSRKDRRRERLIEHAQTAVRQQYDPILQAMQQRLSELGQVVQQGRQPQQEERQAPQSEQIDAAIAQLDQRQDHISTAYRAKVAAGTLTVDEEQAFIKQAREVTDQRQSLATIKTLQRMGINGPQQAVSQEQLQQQAVRAQMQAKHADIYGHQNSSQMVRWATAYFDQKMAENPGRQGAMLADEAMDAARKKFGLASRNDGRPAPTRESRARLGGQGSSGGGQGGGRKQIVVTKAMVTMANAAFSHIPDKDQRIRLWVKQNAGRDE